MNDAFEIVDPALAPALDRARVEPSDADEHINRADKVPRCERGFRCPRHAFAQCLASVPVHAEIIAGASEKVERSEQAQGRQSPRNADRVKRNPELEHFPEKWTPVFRRKCDKA